MQINLGVSPHGYRVVKKKIVEDTHEPMIPIPETSSTKVYRKPYAPVTYVFHTYGLGWRQGYYRGMQCVSQFSSPSGWRDIGVLFVENRHLEMLLL